MCSTPSHSPLFPTLASPSPASSSHGFKEGAANRKTNSKSGKESTNDVYFPICLYSHPIISLFYIPDWGALLTSYSL